MARVPRWHEKVFQLALRKGSSIKISLCPQDWDYTYVHSCYHCALAMSFVLLLPKVNKKAGSAGPPAKLDCSTLCCACI